MTEREGAQPTARPGAIVMSLAGIAEVVISITLFALRVYPVAIAFGLGALFVASIANTISAQARTIRIRRGEPPSPPPDPETRRLRAAGFTAILVVGGGLVVAAVAQFWRGNTLPALTFSMWALCCAVFAMRLRDPGG